MNSVSLLGLELNDNDFLTLAPEYIYCGYT